MAMQIYEGVVRKSVVVLPKGVHLEEGSRVEVRVPDQSSSHAEDLFRQRLLELGLVAEIRRCTAPPMDDNRTPIHVDGQSLSEMIIADRR